MKKNVFILCMILLSVGALGQENMVTVSGGYSFANIEDSEDKGTGWRINASYEFNPNAGMFVHGVAIGYIGLSTEDGSGDQLSTTKINSFPVYYAPKVIFGSNKVRGFVKGALGTQFASFKKDGILNLSDSDFGFYGGGGAGVNIFLNEKIFINLEYEIAWASNSWYKDGWMNSAMGGIGFKF